MSGTPIQKWTRLCQDLVKNVQVFEKTGVQRRTPAYKKAKLEEHENWRKEFAAVTNEIDQSFITNSPDPCYVEKCAEIRELCEKYVTELKQIPDNNQSQNPKTKRTDSLTDAQLFHQRQRARFESLNLSIADVEEKVASGEKLTPAYCKVKNKLITDKWQRIQVVHKECEIDPDDLPVGYEVQIQDMEISIETTLLVLQEGMEEPKDGAGVRLPNLTIPKFTGDYFKWISFRDLFCAVVKNKKSLTDGQRMQLLKGNVAGEAESLIDDLTVSDVNFESAWNRLLNRYDNNRVVVFKYLNKFIAQPVCKTESKSIKKLLDTTDQIILSLQNLNRPVDQWDDWIVLTISQKLSDDVRKDWEKLIGESKDIPTWNQMKTFLENEFRMLEGVEVNHKKQGSSDGKSTEKQAGIKNYHSAIEKGNSCPVCDESHKLFSCEEFKNMEVSQRWEVAKKKKLCFLCLQKHKDSLKCDKKKACKRCDKSHSTWLHENKANENSVVNAFGAILSNKKQVLLATALVTTVDKFGRRMTLRALIDSGSQGSMITDQAAAILQLQQIPTQKYISGLGGNNTSRIKYINLNIKPRFISNVNISIECYILKMLTNTLPDSNLCIDNWRHLKGLNLADPTYHKMGKIDLLLGTEVVSEILQAGFIRGPKGSPMAQETSFGWIVSGNIDPTYPQKTIKCLLATTPDDDLSKFWEMEELNPKRMLTPQEKECEDMFKQTYRRDENGLFIVQIPFKTGEADPKRLGSSKAQCMARFIQMERRFARDKQLKMDYTTVMNEYISAGHMKRVDGLGDNEKLYYIPHHAVIKPDSLTTKTRVVFDASAKTTTGISLNDCMHTGAKQQRDLLEILLNWRKYKIVFKADIEKMYRMIKLDDNDQRYHTVLWRPNVNEPIKEYQLTTVTFGTAAAPYLATRCLNQIAEDGQNEFPNAAKVIKEDFYVDDLISGSDSVEEATVLKEELLTLMESGGMRLRKWTSNSEELLETIDSKLTERSLQSFEENEATKALGLQWNPRTDQFNFKIEAMGEGSITKRKLLSDASKVFDPLGWLAPVVLKPKLLMQRVWDYKIQWDEEVASEIKTEWHQVSRELPLMKKIGIPRWIGCESGDAVQLHGFCDASEQAYAAVVYTRIQKENRVEIKLVAAKTRVAPLKSKLTLPKLELNGGVILSHLLEATKESLQMTNVQTIAWSDSMVALGWIKGEPMRWKTFVANRVSDIQSTSVRVWKYVPSADNPADCASRGIMPSELVEHHLWWTGPEWLKSGPEAWPRVEIEDTDAEQRRVTVNSATVDQEEMLIETSSWFKMVRIMAYVRRFAGKGQKGKNLTMEELAAARKELYKQCQRNHFANEIQSLKRKKPIDSNSKLLSLNPFVDEDGILRVGGRLDNAVISYSNKHPVILPNDHQITKLITQQMHLDTLHGGPQLMINLIRKKYWIVQGKRLATTIYKNCVNCRRFSKTNVQQLMGDLPKDRVTLERAFLHCGVDYAGPFEIKTSRLRNARIVKGYVAIFVCFGTKATHLELVSDMTTEAFMAALNRFIARRGMCSKIYSDNGSNFLGTANKLMDMERKWLHGINQELAAHVSNKGIAWHFIPPGAPNFGGLWESGVRSMKEHVKKTLKTTRLTFEELGTVLCQVEACLNSRPLCPLTSDPDDLNVLTPGHFLIGDALMAPPQPELQDITKNRVNRWSHVQLLQQHFWNRWNVEYLGQLQQRNKWKYGRIHVNIGDIVLIKDERLPPRNWIMGRSIELHPGADSHIRVVTVRTQSGELKRPITKICPLLSAEEPETETEKADKQEIEDHDLGPEAHKIELAKEQQPIKYTNKPVKKVSFQIDGASNEDESTKRFNLRPRSAKKTAIMLAIIAMILLVGGGAASNTGAKVSSFTRNAGLYFEELGRAEVIKTEWRIWLRFQLQPYMQEIERVQKLNNELTFECNKFELTSSRLYCHEITAVIQHNINNLVDSNELMENHHDGRNRRAAPMNGVGWIGHEVFGFMAADQAEDIEDHFNRVEENADYQLQLIKNQTSIVEGTVNLMRATQTELNENYAKIDNALEDIVIATNEIEKKLKIGATSVLMLGLVNRLDKAQSQILDMLTDLHEGHINSQFFTPSQLKTQLQLINDNLPAGNKLPESGRNDMKSLYKIIKGAARVTADGILVEIIIPLVSAAEMQIFKIIPIPIKYGDRQIKIQPASDYLMITLKRDNFYQVSEMEYRSCLKPKERMFICHLSPMYSVPSNRSICERDLLAASMELNRGCKFETSTENEFWTPLEDKNKWIFGVTSQHTLNVVCGKNIETMTIQGLGLIELTPGCEQNKPGMTIIAEAVKQSDGQANYYPSVNLSAAVITSGWQHHIQHLNLTLDHTKTMDNILNDITTLKQNSHKTQTHHIYHYSSKVCFIVIMLILFFVLWVKRSQLANIIIAWYGKSNGRSSDVEQGKNGDTINSDNSKSISGDVSSQEIDSSVVRNKAGECPFRT